jgi:predicted RNase H-like nuclease (RuvC/YqgF family)
MTTIKKDIKISYKQLYENEKKKRENAENNLEQYKKEIELLKIKLEEKDKEIEKYKEKNEEKNEEKNIDLEHIKLEKGYKSSISGNNYEKKIYNICKNCDINHKKL